MNMMKLLSAFLLSLVLVGCTTAPTTPYKQPGVIECPEVYGGCLGGA